MPCNSEGCPLWNVNRFSLITSQPVITLLEKSAPSNRSPISGSGVRDFGIRNVVPQNSHVTKSDDLIARAGIAAPQLGQFSAFIEKFYIRIRMQAMNFISL